MDRDDITALCDLVRGVATPEIEERLRDRSGDSDRTLRLLRRVVEVARKDSEDAVPERVLRAAKAIGKLFTAASSRQKTPEAPLPAVVTYDSLLAPAAAGVRSLQAAERQLVVESEAYTVHLRLAEEGTPPSKVLVGQLVERGQGAAQAVAEAPVLVLAGDRVVGFCLTSRLGEFQVDDLPPGEIDLRLMLQDGASLSVPLGDERTRSRESMTDPVG